MEHLLGLASECRCYINRRYKTFVDALHCALENEADLYVIERQKIRHYRARFTEEKRRRIRRKIRKKKNANSRYFLLRAVRIYVNDLCHSGPSFGYHANASKTWLITKEQHISRARELFMGSKVNITSQGRPYLGAALGRDEFCEQYITRKVSEWKEELVLLKKIAIPLNFMPLLQPSFAALSTSSHNSQGRIRISVL